MSGFRAVHVALALAILAAPASSVRAGEVVRFVSPTPEDIADGPIEVVLVVEANDPPVDRVDVFVDGRLSGSASAPDWRLTVECRPHPEGTYFLAVAYAGDTIVGRAPMKTRALGITQQVQVELVQLYPAVVNRRGDYVHGLRREDFQLFDSGEPVDLHVFEVESARLSIALVLDVSGSMADRLTFLAEASRRFVDALSEDDRIAVYSFNETLARLTDSLSDRAAAREALRTLRAGGATAMYDALALTLKDLASVQGRKAVFLYSDGKDNRSVVSFQRALQAARESSAILFAVRPTARGGSPETEADRQLARLAEDSGGRAIFIRSIEELAEAYDDVVELLRAQYVLAYHAPPGPPGLRTVEVRMRKPGLRAICRETYYRQ